MVYLVVHHLVCYPVWSSFFRGPSRLRTWVNPLEIGEEEAKQKVRELAELWRATKRNHQSSATEEWQLPVRKHSSNFSKGVQNVSQIHFFWFQDCQESSDSFLAPKDWKIPTNQRIEVRSSRKKSDKMPGWVGLNGSFPGERNIHCRHRSIGCWMVNRAEAWWTPMGSTCCRFVSQGGLDA